MAEGLNYNWLYIEGDLPDWLNPSYETVGFTREGIAWAVHQRYQLADTNGVMVSLFPIEDLELFQATAGQLITQQSAATEEITLPPWRRNGGGVCRVITQEECDAIHARLLALDEKRRAEMAKIPTEEDIYRAEQLLLLTELCNGVAALQDSQAGKEDRSNV